MVFPLLAMLGSYPWWLGTAGAAAAPIAAGAAGAALPAAAGAAGAAGAWGGLLGRTCAGLQALHSRLQREQPGQRSPQLPGSDREPEDRLGAMKIVPHDPDDAQGPRRDAWEEEDRDSLSDHPPADQCRTSDSLGQPPVVKKIGEVGQEKGWYGGERSPKVVDLRPSERLKELVRHRKGMERITKKGSEKSSRCPRRPTVGSSLESHWLESETLSDLRGPRSRPGFPDMNEKNTELGRILHLSSLFLRTAPARLRDTAWAIGASGRDRGAESRVWPQASGHDTAWPHRSSPSEVGDTEGPMPAWTTGSDLARRNRSRMPEFRERWRRADAALLQTIWERRLNR